MVVANSLVTQTATSLGSFKSRLMLLKM